MVYIAIRVLTGQSYCPLPAPQQPLLCFEGDLPCGAGCHTNNIGIGIFLLGGQQAHDDERESRVVPDPFKSSFSRWYDKHPGGTGVCVFIDWDLNRDVRRCIVSHSDWLVRDVDIAQLSSTGGRRLFKRCLLDDCGDFDFLQILWLWHSDLGADCNCCRVQGIVVCIENGVFRRERCKSLASQRAVRVFPCRRKGRKGHLKAGVNN